MHPFSDIANYLLETGQHKQGNMTGLPEPGLLSKILPKEVLEQNQTAIEYLDRYRKTISILERTHAAMGKKVVYKSSSGSSVSGSLNLNANGSTH